MMPVAPEQPRAAKIGQNDVGNELITFQPADPGKGAHQPEQPASFALMSCTALRKNCCKILKDRANGGHTTVPQQATAADAAVGPWVVGLAAACTPGQGTPCPWLADLSALATSTAPVGATCSHQCAACAALHCSLGPATSLAVVPAWLWQPCSCPCPCLCPKWAQLPLAQPWCACCAWLAGDCMECAPVLFFVTPQIDAAQLLQLDQQRLVAGVLKDLHGVAELPFAHHAALQLVVGGLEVGGCKELADVLELQSRLRRARGGKGGRGGALGAARLKVLSTNKEAMTRSWE
ncbi:hypothetical protein HaLaN_16672 [Haematococcus lacustris]|uniref:Uncharacterized protein n=1 Tax=Haematococcus lacustris TaxID=44745 RepID=A0A699ZAK3_HAELA|nr:hypothetical protein HaLaN_16672 [Haematococcus lacustris]